MPLIKKNNIKFLVELENLFLFYFIFLGFYSSFLMFDLITLSFRNSCFVFYNLEKGTELCFEINLPFSYTKKKVLVTLKSYYY